MRAKEGVSDRRVLFPFPQALVLRRVLLWEELQIVFLRIRFPQALAKSSFFMLGNETALVGGDVGVSARAINHVENRFPCKVPCETQGRFLSVHKLPRLSTATSGSLACSVAPIVNQYHEVSACAVSKVEIGLWPVSHNE